MYTQAQVFNVSSENSWCVTQAELQTMTLRVRSRTYSSQTQVLREKSNVTPKFAALKQYMYSIQNRYQDARTPSVNTTALRAKLTGSNTSLFIHQLPKIILSNHESQLYNALGSTTSKQQLNHLVSLQTFAQNIM